MRSDVGTDFHIRAFYPEHAKMAQVDVRLKVRQSLSLQLGLLAMSRTRSMLWPSIKEKTDSGIQRMRC